MLLGGLLQERQPLAPEPLEPPAGGVRPQARGLGQLLLGDPGAGVGVAEDLQEPELNGERVRVRSAGGAATSDTAGGEEAGLLKLAAAPALSAP